MSPNISDRRLPCKVVEQGHVIPELLGLKATAFLGIGDGGMNFSATSSAMYSEYSHWQRTCPAYMGMEMFCLEC